MVKAISFPVVNGHRCYTPRQLAELRLDPVTAFRHQANRKGALAVCMWTALELAINSPV